MALVHQGGGWLKLRRLDKLHREAVHAHNQVGPQPPSVAG